MSKIGKKPIEIKSGINVTFENNMLKASGPKGEIAYPIPSGITVTIEDGKIKLGIKNIQDRTKRAVYGLTRANLANLIKGIDTGFEKKLEIQGVGYRAQVQGTDLVLSLGFSHPVKFQPDENVKITVAENIITVAGTDKALVGETAAKIRAVKPPEPYKGKGIRYKGELVKRKVGKAAKAVGTK
jgi:large subunit ribosomal protein L6